MILGGVEQAWIVSMSHGRFDVMCHVFHVIIMRELGGVTWWFGFCLCWQHGMGLCS